jgi:hypothetical protein
MWTKSGDLARPYNSGGPLNRRCDYSNSSTDSVISTLFIGGYHNGDFQISAKAPSTAAYNRLKQAIITAGFPANVTDDSLKWVRVSTSDLDRLRHFLNALKHAESSLNLIEDEIVISLGLTNLNPVAALPTWHKSGDLTRPYNSRGTLNRRCDYSNSSTNSIISELFIGGYRDGSYQIKAEAPSTAAYNRLKQAIITAGFPAPSVTGDTLKTVSVSTDDLDRLRHFLNAIKQEEGSFNLIENEIVTSLGLTNLNPVAALPTWNKTGSFTEINPVGRDSHLNRQVSYTTGAQDSLIKEFQLLGYSDNTYMFCLKLSEDSNTLKELLQNSGLHVTIEEYRDSSRIRLCFGGSSRTRFEQLLTLLSQHSTHFAEINEQFKQHITPVISSVTTPLPTITIFQQPTHLSSSNQQKLDASDFSEDDLTTEEKKQYETYCCVLSKEVMSDPAYDPDFSQYQFERSWILRALASKKEHPFTRAPLTEEKLVSNISLKNTIDSFVNEVISAKASASAPKNTK